MGGPFLVRRYVSLERLATNNEVAGFKFATLGVLYAVLLAFAVIVVWQRFHDAEHAVAAEAGAAATLVPPVLGMGERGEALRGHLSRVPCGGGRSASGRRCSTAAPARPPPMRSPSCTRSPWATSRPTCAATGFQQAPCCASWASLTQARRDRLVMAAGAVPGIIWLVLFTGAVLTISFTFFFGTVNVRNQSLMTGALALLIFSVLVIAVAIDRPFAGPVQISAEPLLQISRHFQQADLSLAGCASISRRGSSPPRRRCSPRPRNAPDGSYRRTRGRGARRVRRHTRWPMRIRSASMPLRVTAGRCCSGAVRRQQLRPLPARAQLLQRLERVHRLARQRAPPTGAAALSRAPRCRALRRCPRPARARRCPWSTAPRARGCAALKPAAPGAQARSCAAPAAR